MYPLTIEISLTIQKDFDGDQIGQFVTPELNALSGNMINWEVQQAADFPNGPSDVALAVLDEKCWIAVTSE